jgi:hypothetical protein
MFPFVDKHLCTYTGSAGGGVCRSQPGEIEKGDSLVSILFRTLQLIYFFVLKINGTMCGFTELAAG